ncbi:UDP-N-acetylglucosamine 2-epimerase (non-hydrolyzing) [bacterium]|nr:UDP-N-acetylglucosamine 2-epimerase (non-hydrolyzing) [bacterium]
MKIILTVGARPNFMKILPIKIEMEKFNAKHPGYNRFNYLLVHTGQHYEENMSGSFFRDLNIPPPHTYLGVGSGTHAEQTAKIMIEFEKVCSKEKPHLVIVVGDVNSTLACSLVTAKLCIPLAHIEAGLRSFDRKMPEEINRVITDSLSDFLFTTCRDANKNLEKEGISRRKIYFAGNVMIDTILKYRKLANSKKQKLKDLKKKEYALLTLHRPSNVDNIETLQEIFEALDYISKKIPIIFPVHPRTFKKIKEFGFSAFFQSYQISNTPQIRGICLLPPLPYLEFLNLMDNAKFVLTDSGGIQEETTFLNVPCLTLRENTERPVTIKEGTNILVGNNKEKIIEEFFNILNGKYKIGKIPELWDGKAAERIINVLLEKII